MEDRFKKTFKISIEDDVETKYGDDYLSHAKEINDIYLRPLKGTDKEEYLLDVLIDIFKSRYSEQEVEDQFIDSISSFDPKLIIKNILNGNLNMENVSSPKLINLFIKTGDVEFLEYYFDKHYKTYPLPISINLAKIINKKPNILKNEKVVEMLKTSLHGLSISDIITFLEHIPVDNIKDIVKPIISRYSLPDQTHVYHKTRVPEELFDKIYDLYKKNIIVLGSFHSAEKIPNYEVAIIKDHHTGLYGYIGNDGKIIIPPKFDEISSVNKNGIITGKVIKKVDSLEPGYYRIDETGKVLEYIGK